MEESHSGKGTRKPVTTNINNATLAAPFDIRRRLEPKSPGGHTGRSNTALRGKYDGELETSDRLRRTTRRGAGTGDLAT
jgi:hypothetical protein